MLSNAAAGFYSGREIRLSTGTRSRGLSWPWDAGLGTRGVSVWSIPAPPVAEASPSCAGEEASIPGRDSRPSPSHQPRSLDGHWDKSVPALTVKDKHLHPRFPLSAHLDLPTLHLPEWYLSSGKSHFHPFNCTGRNHPTEMTHINLADTRTTALWASQLILLCSLPEQTFIR